MEKIRITESDIQNMALIATKAILSEMDFNKKLRMNRAMMAKAKNGEIVRNTKWGQNMHGKERNHKSLRTDIIEWLKNPELDCAQIAKQLWPHKNEDSRRSYFYKCRDNKSYKAHGKKRQYDFTNKEYQKLYSIMKSSALA